MRCDAFGQTTYRLTKVHWSILRGLTVCAILKSQTFCVSPHARIARTALRPFSSVKTPVLCYCAKTPTPVEYEAPTVPQQVGGGIVFLYSLKQALKLSEPKVHMMKFIIFLFLIVNDI